MNSSLYALVKNLSDNDFKYLSQELSAEFLKLISQKGVYPYEYMGSFKKFSEVKLSDRSKFFSCLKDQCISEIDYLRAIDVWNVFKMNTMGDYHDLHLKTDVLLLAAVFEAFINTCLDYYGLDPCHYFRSPGLSWDAMPKKTEIELEIILDIDMHLFIEKGMRGGISYIAKIYSEANNKYLKCYEQYKENKYITYLDADNLYGWAMSQYLLYSKFKWLNQEETNRFDVNSIGESSLDGYILEIVLKYPDELHELHNDYPTLAPEKLEINQNMLSKYCSNIADKYRIKIDFVNNLITNLGNESKYVLHYRNLQWYLSLEMKLVSINRILKFKQSDWLKKYIDFDTGKRRNAANGFDKDFFKLMNNSVFGKTMENLRNRINVRLVNNVKHYIKYISKQIFVSQKMFTKNFFSIHEIKPVLTLNKPIHVGFGILDLSKYLMYEFHYKYIKCKYSANLLFTDTKFYFMKLKQKMFIKIFIKIKICLILVIIYKIRIFLSC